MSAIDKINESLRLQQVYNIFIRYGWDLGFQRWGLLNAIRTSMQRWVWQLDEEEVEPSTPVKVRLMLEELGPTYVKMGQIISSQASTVPSEWEVELEKLQSEVPPFPSETVYQILEEEFGPQPERLYGSFEIEPLAAASTAQVHRATLLTGEAVAVKIQRPGIKDKMKADLGIMQTAARFATARSQSLQAIDLEGMVGEFSKSVMAELDLMGEAYNAVRLGENLASIEGVRVPEVYPELSTPRILTMEFVKGVKISDIDAMKAAGLDLKVVARRTLRAMVKQMLIDGFFHADPHPGNVMVDLDTGTITFLDTGMVGRLGLNQRLNMIQLLVAIQQQDVKGMGQIMYGLSVPFVDEIDEHAYYRDFEDTISRHMYVGAASGFGQTVTVALDLLRRHGLRLDPNLTMAVKALIQAEAAATLLYPEGGFATEGADMAKEMAIEEITADKVVEVVKDQVMMTGRELLKRLPNLQDATIGWLDQYQKGRFEVTVDTSGLDKSVDKLGKLGRQIVIATILVGMIIGSAIATGVLAIVEPDGKYWNFASKLAYGGFVVAMVIGMLIVVGLLWSWIRGKGPFGD